MLICSFARWNHFPTSSRRHYTDVESGLAGRLDSDTPLRPLADMIGSTLGRYEVQALLGAGGMGEVYRARDLKLGREVAIKVLPKTVLSEPDRVARFEREARVLAALNHANIAALFGMEESEGRHFLVMELVEGETLAERLARRGGSGSPGLPLDEALSIARQTAEALEAAHEKRIVHRDLKPANVKVTGDGKVKVLDFGLARAMETGPSASSVTHSPTLSVVATQAGVILGTAAYMSPEQAKGFQADHRSDIFSFGVLLHELLTGRQPFQGDTAAEIMASVMVREADLSGLPADLNPRLPELLRRCLDKNPKQRWQAIGDVRAELDAIAAAPRSAITASVPPKPLWKRALPAVIASVVVASLSAALAWFLKPSGHDVAVVRFAFSLGEGQQFTNAGRHLVAMSPDGREMAYVANSRLYLRSISDLDARPIPGTENPSGVTTPVFSPDGQSLVFWSGTGEIKRIALSGGAALTLCTATNPYGMHWDQDGILIGQGAGGILRVPAAGGKPEVIAHVQAGEVAHGPQMMPDGHSVLFTVASGGLWDTARIVIQSLTSGERKTLIEGGSDARYVPTGHIVYARGGTLFAARFDVRRLEVRNGPVPILEGVRRAGSGTGAAHLSFSNTGSLMYVPGPASLLSYPQDLALVDRLGTTTLLKLPTRGLYEHSRISPDGTRVAFTIDDGKEVDVFVYELNGATSMRRLTFGGNNRYPIWTRDGERIAFQSDREKDLAIFWQRADTSGTAERLTKPDQGAAHIPESWSPTDDRFLYTVTSESTFALWTFSLRDRKGARFDTVESPDPIGSVFSPDGRWVAYATGGTVYVQPFPSTGTRYQLPKINIDHHPMWSPDGKELFYEPAGNQLVALGVQTRPTFSFGNPVSLPAGRVGPTAPSTPRNRDVDPTGKGFIGPVSIDQLSGSAVVREIRVVLNWFEELKQRVPAQ
jgi:serine/threonine-protein kinase